MANHHSLTLLLPERFIKQTHQHISWLITGRSRPFTFSSSPSTLTFPGLIIKKKMASKGSHRQGIVHDSKSFLEKNQNYLAYKAFVHGSMESCSPSWDGAHISQLPLQDSIESKAFNIIGICYNEAEAQDR